MRLLLSQYRVDQAFAPERRTPLDMREPSIVEHGGMKWTHQSSVSLSKNWHRAREFGET